MIEVAIMGYGVVGSGVAEVLMRNASGIAHKAGEEIHIRRILDLRKFPGDPLEDRFTTEFSDIVSDPAIHIVVECMGGLHPAYEFVKQCLESGKSVVSSNKELVAEKGDELLAIAKERNLNFLFEASVGGGIPILRPLDQCLAANEVYEIAGILNGTTNFMLTRMVERGEEFSEALALAQQLGYAEKDPTADVDGIDACRKICILASLAFGRHVRPETVYTEGIRSVTPLDVRLAAAIGGKLKLIGCARRNQEGKVQSLVAPMVVNNACILSQVTDVFNAIMVRGNAVGDTVFYGPGAGKLPTASAVVADVIDEVKHIKARKYLFWESGDPSDMLPIETWICRRLIRFEGGEEAKASVMRVFPSAEMVEAEGMPATEFAVLTQAMSEAETAEALSSANGATMLSCLRVADL